MSERGVSAKTLLREADTLLDEELLAQARAAATGGFAGGSGWMAKVLGADALDGHIATYLGVVKYGLASLAGGATFALLWPVASVGSLVPAVLAFYAVEAQMVFLFPVAITGSSSPFRDAYRLTRAAGGTWAVMRVVLPIAATMLLGAPFLGGLVRAWTVGCLAVVLYYRAIERSVS